MCKRLLLVSSAILAVVSGGRLEPQYLPPHAVAYSSASASAFAGARAEAYSGVPINYENVNNGDGTYRFSFDTPTGISAHESGSPRAAGPEGAAVTAEGAFSYRAPDGQQIALSYTADENGFHPRGAHLPTPPPIPEAILRSIEFNRQNPSSDDGSFRNSNGYRY